MGKKLFQTGVLLCFIRAAALPATADVTFGFSQGDLSASATFIAAGDTLTVILENTATVDVHAPGDVLTGVFFDIDGFVGDLTRGDVLLSSLSVLFFDPDGAGPLPGLGNTELGYNNYAGDGDIGAEVGYRTGAFALGGVGDHAIGHVGMDDFMGTPSRFDLDNSHNIQGPASLNGIEYGIVNSGYTGGGNAPINGPHALLTSGVEYTFAGFTGFGEGKIGNVSFNYGTEFNPIPAPTGSILGLLGFGMITLRWSTRPAV